MTIKLTIWLVGILIVLSIKGPDWYMDYKKSKEDERKYKAHLLNTINESQKINTTQHTELYQTIVKNNDQV